MLFVCTHVCTRMYSYDTSMSFVCDSYVLVCHPYVSCIYSYVIRTSLVYICMLFVSHSYILVCDLHITICTPMWSVCHSYVVAIFRIAEKLMSNLNGISNGQTNFNPFLSIRILTLTSIHFVKFPLFTLISIHFVNFQILTLISIYFVKFWLFTPISILFRNFRITTLISICITGKLKILRVPILWLLYHDKLDKFIFQKRTLKALFWYITDCSMSSNLLN